MEFDLDRKSKYILSDSMHSGFELLVKTDRFIIRKYLKPRFRVSDTKSKKNSFFKAFFKNLVPDP